jgi:hypothetical protein
MPYYTVCSVVALPCTLLQMKLFYILLVILTTERTSRQYAIVLLHSCLTRNVCLRYFPAIASRGVLIRL